MLTVKSTHKLSRSELSILQRLIGKSLTFIDCSGADLTSKLNCVNFIDTVNLSFQDEKGFISISATFDETNFGDDFISINIQQQKNAVGIKTHKEGGLQHPFVHLSVYPEFIIRRIEVFGDSYECHSDNIAPNPYWKIEIDNPGKAVTERIETENVILFYSANQRLLICPYGAVPWIQVTFDEKFIDDSFNGVKLHLKHELK